MPLLTPAVNKNMWKRSSGLYSPVERRNFPVNGLVFYAPLWNSISNADPFNAWNVADGGVHSCDVSGAVWGSQGYTFDGVDDEITLPTAFDALTDLTWELWVKAASGGDTSKLICGFYNNDSNRFNPFFRSPAGAITSELFVGVTNYAVTANSAYVADQWYHLVIRLGTGGMDMILDGVLQDDTDVTELSFADIAPMTEVLFGSYKGADTTNRFKGVLGEFRLYSRRLSIPEILHIYQQNKWRYL